MGKYIWSMMKVLQFKVRLSLSNTGYLKTCMVLALEVSQSQEEESTLRYINIKRDVAHNYLYTPST